MAGARATTSSLTRCTGLLTAGRGRVPEEPARILVCAIGYLGDTVLSLPFLEALRQRWPSCQLEVWCAPRCRELFEGLQLHRVLVSGAVPADRTRETGRPWSARQALLGELRRRRYDLLADLSGVPGTTLLSWLAGARCTAGWSDQGLGACYDVAVPYDQPGEHLLERRRRLAWALGLPAEGDWHPTLQPGAFPPAGPREGEQPVLLHVGAGWAAKRWPPVAWGALARLLRDQGHLVQLTCGPGESPLLQAAREAAGLPLAGSRPSRSLGELVQRLQQARLLVVADSGPAHLAAALGRPVVALFGPTDPARCAPLGPAARALRSPAACMEQLTPEAVARFLATSGG